MELIRTLLVSVLSRLIGEEIAAWVPRICNLLTEYAVRALPATRRERFEEEWRSHLDEVTGLVGKLFASTGFLVAASKVRLESPRVDKFERWLETSVRLQDWHAKAATVIDAISSDNNLASDEQVKSHLTQLRTLLRDAEHFHDHLVVSLKRHLEEYLALPPQHKFIRVVQEELIHSRKMRTVDQSFRRMSERSQLIQKMTGEILEQIEKIQALRLGS